MLKNGLRPFLGEIASYKIPQIYLDGSFVTNKENPDDIDGYALTSSNSKLCDFLLANYDHWQEDYRIDFYPGLTEEEGDMSKVYWESLFSYEPRFKTKKGYVALILKNQGGDSGVSTQQ